MMHPKYSNRAPLPAEFDLLWLATAFAAGFAAAAGGVLVGLL